MLRKFNFFMRAHNSFVKKNNIQDNTECISSDIKCSLDIKNNKIIVLENDCFIGYLVEPTYNYKFGDINSNDNISLEFLEEGINLGYIEETKITYISKENSLSYSAMNVSVTFKVSQTSAFGKALKYATKSYNNTGKQ